MFGKEADKTGAAGRALLRPNHSLGESSDVPGKSPLGLSSGSKSCEKSLELPWPAVGWVKALCKRCGKDRSGKASGLTRPRGTACACARRPPIRTFQGSNGPLGEFFFFLIVKGAGGGFE